VTAKEIYNIASKLTILKVPLVAKITIKHSKTHEDDINLLEILVLQ